MKNSKRISVLVEQLKKEGFDSVASAIENSINSCPEFGEEEVSAEEFKDIMLAYLSRITPENFDHLVNWDHNRILDQEKAQAAIVYQAKCTSRKLQVIGSQVVIAASIVAVVLN